MRYRKKPGEVEAWQVGSDEPAPEWAQMYILFTRDGTWLVKEDDGDKVHINKLSPGIFEQTYEVIE